MELVGGKREKKMGGGGWLGRKKNRSHRATVQAPAKTARVEKEERGAGGVEEGEKDPGETLNRCVKPLSAFLLGNARSGASRKTI